MKDKHVPKVHMRLSLKTLYIYCVLFSCDGNSQELSPYSPAFILKPEQVESSTSLGINWVNAQFSSQTSSSSAKIAVIGGGETISVGLPNDFQVGAGVGYSDFISKSPSTLNVVTGWSNPALYANKTWFSNTPTRVKLFLSASPKTGDSGTRGSPSLYATGIAGIHISPSGLVSAVSLTQSMADNSGSNQAAGSTSLSGAISKDIGAYLLNGSIGATRVQSMIYQSGVYLQPSFAYSANLGISRSIVENIWVGASYAISQNKNTTEYRGIQGNAKTINNSITTSISILF